MCVVVFILLVLLVRVQCAYKYGGAYPHPPVLHSVYTCTRPGIVACLYLLVELQAAHWHCIQYVLLY